jgi:RNA polymerase sigma factor (sigma-70 family)
VPYEPRVRAWLLRAGWNPDEIEDLIQESYAKLAGCSLEAIRNPRPFFFQTVRNAATSTIRRRRVLPIRSIADTDGLNMADPAPGPEDELSAYEELERLKRAIDQLPVACRRVFILRKIEGLSQRETARELGVSESAVEKQVARGIRLCAAMLTKPMEAGVPGVLAPSFWSRKVRDDRS